MRASSQFKKGALEMCVLHFIQKEDRYGYELTQRVNQFIPITEGALYPVLRRLVKESYCVIYTKESPDGPSRKYYQMTDKGNEYLKLLERDWDEFVEQVNKLREAD